MNGGGGGGDDGDSDGEALTAPDNSSRDRGITYLLGFKCVLTLLSGLPVLLTPRAVLDPLGFKVITPAHVLSTKMWGVWQSYLQCLLELTFAFFVRGTPRNLFLLCEAMFEVGLAVEVHHDYTTTNAGKYSDAIHKVYLGSPPLFFAILLLCPDAATDVATQRKAYAAIASLSALLLGAQVTGLRKGVDFGSERA